MDQSDILETLISQALEDGAQPLTLRAIVEDASQTGAQRALAHIGLSDTSAHHDITELRQLLTSWHDVQTTARRTIVRWFTTLLLSFMVLGVLVFSGVSTLKP